MLIKVNCTYIGEIDNILIGFENFHPGSTKEIHLNEPDFLKIKAVSEGADKWIQVNNDNYEEFLQYIGRPIKVKEISVQEVSVQEAPIIDEIVDTGDENIADIPEKVVTDEIPKAKRKKVSKKSGEESHNVE